MKITIIGAGYVGLSLAMLLSSDNEVTIVDKDEKKIEMINDGVSPLRESDIIKAFAENKDSIIATSSIEEPLINADLIIIAVSTDFNNELNRFELHNVESIINVAYQVNTNATIVIKSTIPVGFTNEICHKYNGTSNLLYCPEFLREGKSLHDNLYPSRIIIGTKTGDLRNAEKASAFADVLKQSVLSDNVQVLFMGYSEAESVKLFSNAFLALRVAFFNELDMFAETKGFNTKEIIEGVCLDSRIGMFYNNPSFGYGGYCLPKDTKQLLADFDVIPHDVISAIVSSNQKRKEYIVHRIISLSDKIKLEKKLDNVVIGVYRLVMKSHSANCRYSSVIDVIYELLRLNYSLVIFEPCDIDFSLWHNVRISENEDEFKKSVDIIIANRYDDNLTDFEGVVYTRDIFSEINNRQNLNAIVTRIVKKELLTFLISIFENGDFCILIIQCTGKHQSNTRKAPAYARNTLANDTIAVPTVIDLAVLEFVAVGTDCKAFLSSSVKGGERHTVTSVRKTTLCLCYARSAFLWQITSFLARIGDIHTRRNDVFLPSCVCRQRNRTLAGHEPHFTKCAKHGR